MSRFTTFVLAAMLVGCGGAAEVPNAPLARTPRRYPTPPGAAVPSARPATSRGPAFVGVPEEGMLPNGVRVRVYPDASLPLVSVAFVMSRPPSEEDGYPLRWLFSRAMLGATGTHTQRESFSALAYVATTVGARVDDESIVWSFDTLEPLWPTAFRRVAGMISDPRFEADDVARELPACELAQLHSTSDAVLVRSLYGARHPFVVAEDASCKGLGPKDVRAYRDRALGPKNLTVVVAGDVSLAEVVQEATDDFPGFVDHGMRPARPVPPVLAAPPTSVTTVSSRAHPGQVKVFLGLPAVGVVSPDLPALEVLAEALGAPLSGRLDAKVRRERGSTYGVSVSVDASSTTGALVVRAAVAASDAAGSIAALLQELERVRGAALSGRELATAKRSALLRISTRYEGPSAAMRDVSHLTALGLPHWGALAKGIDAVSAADVRRVAERYLSIEHMQVVLEGEDRAISEVAAGLAAAADEAP